MKKTFIIITGEIVLCVLNIYTVLYLACESIMPFYNFMYNKMNPVYDTFFNLNGGSTNQMMAHYVPLLFLAFIAFVVLMFIYIGYLKKEKMSVFNFSCFVLSIVPYIFWLVFVSRVTFNLIIDLGDYQKYLYWVLILFFITNIAFSLQRCFAIKKIKKE